MDEAQAWVVAYDLHERKKLLLAEAGETMLRIQAAEKQISDMRDRAVETKAKLIVVDGSLQSAVSEIMKANEALDGDYTLDFDNQVVVPKHGQVSDSVGSEPRPND